MIKCKTRDTRLCFDEKRAILSSLTKGGKEFIGGEMPVFALAVLDGEGERHRTDASDFTLLSSRADENGFSLTYGGALATVRITLRADTRLVWGLEVTPSHEYLLEWVNYPQICVPNTLCGTGGQARILWGYNEGAIIDDLAVRNRSFAYMEPDYPHVSVMGMYPAMVETQMLAYYDDEGGLYFAAEDENDALKGIDFYEAGGGILLQLRHYPGNGYGARYEMPYPAVIDFFKGDWQDAAELYRAWFTSSQKVKRYLPISQNSSLPPWYGDSPVVVTYPVRGRFDTDEMRPNKLFPYVAAMKHIERLERELGSRLLVLLMHWEGTAPWAPPFVWPPFGGEEAFSAFVAALHERGDLIGVYCSGLGFTEKSRLVDDYDMKDFIAREGLSDIFCRSPKGELPYSRICTAQRAGYDMCPACQRTEEMVYGEVKRMSEAGIDYIQLMDQNHGGTSHFCYASNHGHPPVPGRWQVDAMKRLLKRVTDMAPGVLFGCESAAAEAYIPYLLFSDNRYNLCYRYGTPVPLYAYIYHEYVNNFMGNQVCAQYAFRHDASPDNLLYRISHAFIAGDMLTLVLDEEGEIDWNWSIPAHDDRPNGLHVKTLVRNLNAWRRGAGKKYLHTGRMVKQLPTRSDPRVFYRALSRELWADSVATSAWMTGEGDFGQFLCNYNPYATEARVLFPEGEFRLSSLEGELGRITGGEEVCICLPPLTAYLLERIG